MLVLSRKLGEHIVIGSGESAVLVTLMDIDRGRVRIGITADRTVRVDRHELLSPAELAALPPAARRAVGNL